MWMLWVLGILLFAVPVSVESGFDEKYERDYNIFNPANRYTLDNPLNQAQTYAPDNLFNPANRYDPRNPVNPVKGKDKGVRSKFQELTSLMACSVLSQGGAYGRADRVAGGSDAVSSLLAPAVSFSASAEYLGDLGR